MKSLKKYIHCDLCERIVLGEDIPSMWWAVEIRRVGQRDIYPVKYDVCDHCLEWPKDGKPPGILDKLKSLIRRRQS